VTCTRRAVLRAGVAGGALALSGCERLLSAAAHELQATPDAPIGETTADEVDPAFHLLSRAAFGPWPGDVDRVRALGAESWVEEQLQPEAIDDRACDLRAGGFDTLALPADELWNHEERVVIEELRRATLLRAIYSRRQLQEVLVELWSDHLNIDVSKGACGRLKTVDDREVIRPHTLGRFRDLLRASALSPAMLIYLDGAENRRRTPDERPNENYGREVLELHTLGVDGGYTQGDVMEAARCLTGWRVLTGWRRGHRTFDAAAHDDGQKVVLGVTIPAGGGEGDLERLLDVLCGHPSTAHHVARKLCVRFVSHEPPAALVSEVAGVFRETGGDLRACVRAVLRAPAFRASGAARVKRPFRFVVSALRALAAETRAPRPLLEVLERLGQPLFAHPTPDGYPDEPGPWMGTLLWRWTFVQALARGELPGVRVDLQALRRLVAPGDGHPDLGRAGAYLLGRALTPGERRALEPTWSSDPRDGLGALLASPAFQRC
jgi:hypothetical protein